VVQAGGNIVALAVDDARSLLFWANNGRRWRAIYRAETNGNSLRPIATAGSILSTQTSVLSAKLPQLADCWRCHSFITTMHVILNTIIVS